MNIVNQKIEELTIIEALEFCVDKKVEGSQERLESVIKAKKLATSQKKTLQEILECFYKNVKINGGGLKSGKVLLSEPFENEKKRITGNDTNEGRPIAETTTLMNEFIFKQLVSIVGDNESVSYTLNKWYQHIGLYTLQYNEIVSLHEVLIKEYRPFHSKISVTGMRDEVKLVMNERIYYVHNYAFEQLVKTNRIDIDYIYKLVLSDEMVESIENFNKLKGVTEKVYPVQEMSDKLLEDVQNAEAKYAEELGVTFEEYQTARLLPRYAKKTAKEILPKMDKMLIEEFSIKSYFREVEISIINPEIKKDVSKKDARKVFIDKTVELHYKRCKKEEYTKATTYTKKFFRLNFLLLLQLKGFDGVEGEINRELFTLKFRIDEVIDNYIEEMNKTNEGDALLADIESFETHTDVNEELGDFFDIIKTNDQNKIEHVALTTMLE